MKRYSWEGFFFFLFMHLGELSHKHLLLATCSNAHCDNVSFWYRLAKIMRSLHRHYLMFFKVWSWTWLITNMGPFIPLALVVGTMTHFSTASPASTSSKSHYCMFSEGKEPWNINLLVLDLCCCPAFLKTIYFIWSMTWKVNDILANEVNYRQNFKLPYTTRYSLSCSREGLILYSWQK